MRVSDWLKTAIQELTAAGIATARLDCLVLIEDVTGKDRAWLLAHPEFELTGPQHKKLETNIQRRSKHEPLAYIRGKTEFYGQEFLVSKDTLEPRPETETMVELVLKLPLTSSTTVADIGTGSAAIAISVKLQQPNLHVVGTEVSKLALDIARQNVQLHKVDVQLYQGHLLEPLLEQRIFPHVLLCNLPYVPNSFTINSAAMQEPRIAIFGGADGLDIYRQLFNQIEKVNRKPQWILTESLPPQHSKLATIAKQHDYHQQTESDFIQVFTASEQPPA